MTRISLGTMHARGIRLSPHEAIAVVHQVCELLKHGDERGRPLAAPARIELFVTEDGGVDIDPKRPILAAGGGGSCRNLIDELLPFDAGDREKTSTGDVKRYAAASDAHPFRFASNSTSANERDLLRQLFERARRHVATTEVRLSGSVVAGWALVEPALTAQQPALIQPTLTTPSLSRSTPTGSAPTRSAPTRSAPIRSAPIRSALSRPALSSSKSAHAAASLPFFDQEMAGAATSGAPEPVAIELAAASDVAFADAVERSVRPWLRSASFAALSSPSPSDAGGPGMARIDENLGDAGPTFLLARPREPSQARPDVSVDSSPELYSAGWHSDEAAIEVPTPGFENATWAAGELEDSGFDVPHVENDGPDRDDFEKSVELGEVYATPIVTPPRRHPAALMTAAAFLIVASAGGLVARLERSDPGWRDQHVSVLAARVTQQLRTPVGGTRSSDAEPAVAAAASATTADIARQGPAVVATLPDAAPGIRDRAVAMPSLATAAEIVAAQRQRVFYSTEPGESTPASSGAGLIAFEDDRDGQPRGVYIDKQDGSGAMRVSGGGRAAAPTWSSDRAYLAFVRTEPGRPDVWNLWIYRVGSGELRRLTTNTSGVVRGATWFPGGERLCYGHGSSIAVANVETGATRRYPSPLPGRSIGRSSVSPNGRQVAFALERDGIWLLDVGTGRMRRVIDDADATDDMSWSGRGSRLVYYSLSARGEGAWRGAPTEIPTAFH